jgi:hypothetical protein
VLTHASRQLPAWLIFDVRQNTVHPALKFVVLFVSTIAVFWGALALVDRLQKGKKKNFPALDSSGDEPYSDKGAGDD